MRRKSIGIDTPAVRHGIGLFETMLVVKGLVPFASEHFLRLAATAASLRFAAPERKLFDVAVIEAAAKVASLAEAMIRLQWLAVAEPFDDVRNWKLFATAGALPAATLSRRRMGRAVSLDRRATRSLPFAKSTSWLVTDLALRQTVANGADEALFADSRGRYLEGTSTNLFAVQGDRLITAPVSAGILPGVMRGWVMENAARAGWVVTERPPTREEVLGGSFMTSSLTKIAAVKRLDGVNCARLSDLRFAMLQRLLRQRLTKPSSSEMAR